jgi:putative aldouronate transport system permease protein
MEMKRKLETSELIFKILAYFFLTIFALCCLYPFIYSISSAISGKQYVENNNIILLPKAIQFDAFIEVFNDNAFWSSYANTLFLTFFGTIFSLIVAILGAYALSKSRLLFRKQLNFFLVFTMWFSAGVVPQFLNYTATQNIMYDIGIMDDKWLVVLAMGMAAMNIILLRNAFEGIPKEIEEASIVDGATEFQVLTKVYIPMSKSTIATVGLFFGISRWNGYYWARTMMKNTNEWPLQVYIRNYLETYIWNSDTDTIFNTTYSENSIVYAMVVCSIIPILIIYPYIQKYFAKGVNMGGVKE